MAGGDISGCARRAVRGAVQGAARGAGLAALLAACQPSPPVALANTGGQIAVLRLAPGTAPPHRDGQCWASDTTPAVLETVTEQVQLRPERRAADGTVVEPAQFSSQSSQRQVQARETVWFRAACPVELTVDLTASLQRALKARGWYLAPVTGAWDRPTLTALRAYQRARGLDSDKLSLDAAQDLGLLSALPRL